jgi:adenylylsulfate kinase-like enzyme
VDTTPTLCPCGCGAVVPAGVAERERGVRADASAAALQAKGQTARPGAILVLSGMPGAGKSTVARILAGRFDRGVHLDLDLILHHFVVAGPVPYDPAQIELALRNAGALAANFHDRDFGVVVEGAIPDRASLEIIRSTVAPRPVTLVVLAPPLSVSVQRDRDRGGKQVAHLFTHLDAPMRTELASEGVWLDTAGMTPAQTAEQVLATLRRPDGRDS